MCQKISKPSKFSDNKEIVFAQRGNKESQLYVQSNISEDTPCINSEYESYMSEKTYLLDKFYGKETCIKAQVDKSYEKIDSYSYEKLFKENVIIFSDMIKRYKPPEINLYVRGYIRISQSCRRDIVRNLNKKGNSVTKFYSSMKAYKVYKERIIAKKWVIYLTLAHFIIFGLNSLINMIARNCCLPCAFQFNSLAKVLFFIISIFNIVNVSIVGIVASDLTDFATLSFEGRCFKGDYKAAVSMALNGLKSAKTKIVVATVFSGLNIIMLYWEIKVFLKLECLQEDNELGDLFLSEEEILELNNREKKNPENEDKEHHQDKNENMEVQETSNTYVNSNHNFLPPIAIGTKNNQIITTNDNMIAERN